LEPPVFLDLHVRVAKDWQRDPKQLRKPRILRGVRTGRHGMRSETTGCVVVGGGPRGHMTGLLLARPGCRSPCVEKHPDFLRDFRGDTGTRPLSPCARWLGLFEKFNALAAGPVTAVGFPPPTAG